MAKQAHEALAAYFSEPELPTLHQKLKTCFRMAAFETTGEIGDEERQSLSSLYYLVELLGDIVGQ
jgi:hypothetical protein